MAMSSAQVHAGESFGSRALFNDGVANQSARAAGDEAPSTRCRLTTFMELVDSSECVQGVFRPVPARQEQPAPSAMPALSAYAAARS
jgi:hypothetical protein